MSEKDLENVFKVVSELKDNYRYDNFDSFTLEEVKNKLCKYEYKEVSLLYTDKFEIKYVVETNKFQLKTTYSNQSVTDQYINEISNLHDLVSQANVGFENS